MRYGRIYKAFLDADVALLRLQPMSKHPVGKAWSSRVKSVFELELALERGENVGAVTHLAAFKGSNPLRFCNLDVDRSSPLLTLTPYTVRVRRPGQDSRAQYWYRMGLDITMEYQRDARGWELATWNAVLPGSTHPDGSTYQLEVLDHGEWVEWDGEPFGLDDLPVLDPYAWIPPIQKPPPRMLHDIALGESPQWVAATGRLPTLVRKARHYLRCNAPPSISGMGGHSALFCVICNLRLYHRLDFRQALALIREEYDTRCIDAHGRPYPWSDKELTHKWENAGMPGMWPNLGVADRRARARVAANNLVEAVPAFLADATGAGGSCLPSHLLEAYWKWSGRCVGPKAFGTAMRVLGYRTTTAGGGRRYAGFHLVPPTAVYSDHFDETADT
jgi:hypothetical protein